jgi:hypothetical protein
MHMTAEHRFCRVCYYRQAKQYRTNHRAQPGGLAFTAVKKIKTGYKAAKQQDTTGKSTNKCSADAHLFAFGMVMTVAA